MPIKIPHDGKYTISCMGVDLGEVTCCEGDTLEITACNCSEPVDFSLVIWCDDSPAVQPVPARWLDEDGLK